MWGFENVVMWLRGKFWNKKSLLRCGGDFFLRIDCLAVGDVCRCGAKWLPTIQKWRP